MCDVNLASCSVAVYVDTSGDRNFGSKNAYIVLYRTVQPFVICIHCNHLYSMLHRYYTHCQKYVQKLQKTLLSTLTIYCEILFLDRSQNYIYFIQINVWQKQSLKKLLQQRWTTVRIFAHLILGVAVSIFCPIQQCAKIFRLEYP